MESCPGAESWGTDNHGLLLIAFLGLSIFLLSIVGAGAPPTSSQGKASRLLDAGNEDEMPLQAPLTKKREEVETVLKESAILNGETPVPAATAAYVDDDVLLNWRPKLPCNVIEDAPITDWRTPAMPAQLRRAPNWVCTKVKANKMNGKALNPRKNKDEERRLKEWWLHSHDAFLVECWSSSVVEGRIEQPPPPLPEAGVCTKTMRAACPAGDWLMRAGLGNRYFFLAATITLADRMNVPFVTPTPLLAAGATLPTSFANATGWAPWEERAASPEAGACIPGPCSVPTGKLDPGWGPDQFGQGRFTGDGLARLRPVMCDMMAAPNTLGTEKAPGRDDIVVHFRSESKGEAKGFPGFPFLERAIADAREMHSGKNVVIVGMRPCFRGHPNVVRLIAKYGATLRVVEYPAGSNAALKDLQFMAMARILILSVSTFSYWSGYFSETAHAIYFPIPDRLVQFNPWCNLVEGFRTNVKVKYVDCRTGELLQNSSDATAKCNTYYNDRSASKNSSIRAKYGLPHGDLEPGGCWK